MSGHVFARSTENFQLVGTWQGFFSQLFTKDLYGVLKRFEKCFNIWMMEFTAFESGLEVNGR